MLRRLSLWPLVLAAAAGSTAIYIAQRQAAQRCREAKIDEMSEQSFPASDPPGCY